MADGFDLGTPFDPQNFDFGVDTNVAAGTEIQNAEAAGRGGGFWGGLISAGAGILGSAASGGGTEVSGLTLPPEKEIQFLDDVQGDLTNLDADIVGITEQQAVLNERLDLFDQIVEGTISSQEALERLNQSTERIAQTFANSLEEFVSEGLITKADQDDLDRARRAEDQDFRDPGFERSVEDERNAFEQNLARSGVSPQQRLNALREFDRAADERRFSRTEQLRSGLTSRALSRVQTSAGARATGIQSQLAGLQGLQGQLDFNRQGAQQLAGSATARFQFGLQGAQARSNLRGERRQTFKDLGEFDFSARAQQALAEGQVGPGTVGNQLSAAAGQAGAVNRNALPAVNASDNQGGMFQQQFARMSDDQLQRFLQSPRGVGAPRGTGPQETLLQRQIRFAQQEATRRRLIG